MIIRLSRILIKKWVDRWRLRVSSAGFTMVELLVTIAIISVMLAALAGLFSKLSISYTTEEVKAEAQQDLRATVDLMVRDIRMAGLDPTLSTIFGVVTATSTEIGFTMDSNESGSIDDADLANNIFERITYELNGNQLVQTLDKGIVGVEDSETVIDNVIIPPADPPTPSVACTNVSLDDNPLFCYFDEDGNWTATPADIRQVEVTMTVQLPAGSKGTVTRRQNVRIQCRNLWF